MKTAYRTTLLGLALLAGLSGWAWGLRPTIADDKPAAAEKPAEKVSPTKTYMRAKLQDCNHVLEGLATEDFKLIQRGAEHMQLMSRAAEWSVVEGPVYAQLSGEFRRCCEDLIKRAKEKNADAAALSYMQLTMACMNCHRYVRSTRVALRDQVPEISVATLNSTEIRD